MLVLGTMAALAGRLTVDITDLGTTVSVVDHTVAIIATVYWHYPFSCQVLIKSSIDHVSGGSSSRGAGSSSFSDNRRGYEEYNAGDDEVTQSSSPTRVASGRNVVRKSSVPAKRTTAPEVDLLGGFDDDTFGAPVPSPGANKELPSVGIDGMFHFPKSTMSWESLYILLFFY
jgi:hypothetical protein